MIPACPQGRLVASCFGAAPESWALRPAFPPILSVAQAGAAQAEFGRLLLCLNGYGHGNGWAPLARDLDPMTDTIGTYLAAHAAGKALTATIEETYSRIERHDDPALFIAIRSKAEAFAIAERVQASGPERKPLYGVPFVVKDNIDVAGLPTTAACPAFSYRPGKSAFVVEKLERAGAIAIGKTNLDQFATGLVGVRSPYGVPRNALRGDLIPGGSSSGSATAVGAGLVPFSLGTDTAGSGRVPAAFNGIVGLKPSLGSLSASGVVPACRTLDTISIFARDVADAFAVHQQACAFDEAAFGWAFLARINGSSSTTQTRQPRSRATFS
jgi:Asp-tRNA(Asn)/Glu-tRNA(Gln) amidotransferase A subunit family amidase